MPRETFMNWFERMGNSLLNAWLRAKQDGNEELFADYVIGEYRHYRELRDKDQYEVPYHGLFDPPSEIELLIAGRV